MGSWAAITAEVKLPSWGEYYFGGDTEFSAAYHAGNLYKPCNRDIMPEQARAIHQIWHGERCHGKHRGIKLGPGALTQSGQRPILIRLAPA